MKWRNDGRSPEMGANVSRTYYVPKCNLLPRKSYLVYCLVIDSLSPTPDTKKNDRRLVPIDAMNLASSGLISQT